jgi:flagellar M-ring protein FliF
MSFDQVQRTTATVDPDKQVIASEQKNEIVPGAQGGAGQNNTATTYENSTNTESYVAAPGSLKRLTVAVLVADRAPAAGSKAAPTPRTPAELAQIETMVRSAVGADSTRGDVVSVVSVPFAPVVAIPPAANKTDIIRVVQTAQRPILGVLALVLIIVLALISLKAMKPGAASAHQVLALQRGEGASGQLALQPATPMPMMMPQNTIRDRVNSTIEQQPDVAARVVRAWLKEA